ncbi:MAG: hypothetical protein EP298_00900 [Gammaproteobacteria bacterium]|nr:MAG: hypothetical protein EP298_00900 [Gammaproteobacteria bacterium]UTW41824.1 hypothetical protein KFE69_09965 [bacterium SCSIO 12844]
MSNKTSRINKLFLVIVLLFVPFELFAKMIPLSSNHFTWYPTEGTSLPKGADVEVLYSDKTCGHYAIRVRGNMGYKIPKHYYDGDEHILILNGSVELIEYGAHGAKKNERSETVLNQGQFKAVKSKQVQALDFLDDNTIVELHLHGGDNIYYIHEKDDPRLKQ